jgi:hypothetical protein
MKIIPYPRTKIEDTEWTALDPQKVLSGAPRSSYKILYANKSKELYSGVYECTAGKWTVHYEEDEFCTIVEGRIILTGEDGESHEFSAMDSFMIPAGFHGTWEALTYMRKFFVIYENIK